MMAISMRIIRCTYFFTLNIPLQEVHDCGGKSLVANWGIENVDGRYTEKKPVT